MGVVSRLSISKTFSGNFLKLLSPVLVVHYALLFAIVKFSKAEPLSHRIHEN
jgi:hypothetical protein